MFFFKAPVFYFYRMKIKSTNLSQPRTVSWRGKYITTGIFKTPVPGPIFLGKESVSQDHIADKRVHGGTHKACYLFSASHYNYWKDLYPELDWDWGMFGENLTVEGLDESNIYIGDIYKLGSSLVQVSQPREPCFKLGIRFGSQQILKQFIDHAYPGTYLIILKEGEVKPGDSFKLVERKQNKLSTRDLFRLIFSTEKDAELLKEAVKMMPFRLRREKS